MECSKTFLTPSGKQHICGEPEGHAGECVCHGIVVGLFCGARPSAEQEESP